eukprot:UN12129
MSWLGAQGLDNEDTATVTGHVDSNSNERAKAKAT